MANKNSSGNKVEFDKQDSKEKLNCGIVMPISSIDNCTAEHWKEVADILGDAISFAGFNARLVSDSEDSGIIQKRIIQNLYSDPIVVCDVSGKNPNVMFELGMRLAFDKPTIIVKDDKTDYSFDTSQIEHVQYPRDLRFASIVKFKEVLTEKIKGTYKQANEDKNYTTFLKHFGKFKVAELEEQIVGKDDYILKSIEDLRDEVRRIPRSRPLRELSYDREDSDKFSIVKTRVKRYFRERGILYSTRDVKDEKLKENLFNYLSDFNDIRDVCLSPKILKETIELILQDT